jgi:hypothetical protein
MTDWIAFYLYVVFAVCVIAGIWIYGKLGKEPDEPGPKMHPYTIRYLAERERRLR